MKIFVFWLVLLIQFTNSTKYQDEIDQLRSLLYTYERHKYPPADQLNFDRIYGNNDNYNSDGDGDDSDDNYNLKKPLSSFDWEKIAPSRINIFNKNDYHFKGFDRNPDDDRSTSLPTIDNNKISINSICTDNYDIQHEQLLVVRDLKNGGQLLRHTFIETNVSLSSSNNYIKEKCMIDCCAEERCELAMLEEQPTRDGYKCYLFHCSGSCRFVSHRDYTVLTLKKDSSFYKSSNSPATREQSSSTIASNNLPNKKSFFQETIVIAFLIFGLICTCVFIIFIVSYCRESRKRGRRKKHYAVDEDYLINGLYL